MTDPFQRIRESLGENLFVEAGAGTGKTKALVDRLVALVDAGVPITEIVAITCCGTVPSSRRSVTSPTRMPLN